jgi:hypothetical protein
MYKFFRFGIMYEEKSGNPVDEAFILEMKKVTSSGHGHFDFKLFVFRASFFMEKV